MIFGTLPPAREAKVAMDQHGSCNRRVPAKHFSTASCLLELATLTAPETDSPAAQAVLQGDAVKLLLTSCHTAGTAGRDKAPTAAHNMLQEDAETVRFNESAKAAQDSVNKVLESYGALAQQLDEEERGKLQRSMGMKMEQLKVRALMSSTSASLMC